MKAPSIRSSSATAISRSSTTGPHNPKNPCCVPTLHFSLAVVHPTYTRCTGHAVGIYTALCLWWSHTSLRCVAVAVAACSIRHRHRHRMEKSRRVGAKTRCMQRKRSAQQALEESTHVASAGMQRADAVAARVHAGSLAGPGPGTRCSMDVQPNAACGRPLWLWSQVDVTTMARRGMTQHATAAHCAPRGLSPLRPPAPSLVTWLPSRQCALAGCWAWGALAWVVRWMPAMPRSAPASDPGCPACMQPACMVAHVSGCGWAQLTQRLARPGKYMQ